MAADSPPVAINGVVKVKSFILNVGKLCGVNGITSGRLMDSATFRLFSTRFLKPVNPFDNRVVIIDEAHNTNPQISKADTKKFSPCITKILRYAENTKLILLSATPINNSPRDIVWLLNLLLLNDKRGIIDTAMLNEIFTKTGEFKNKGAEKYFLEEVIRKKGTGYISYIRSENPLTYPLRISPFKNIAKVTGGNCISRKTALKYRCY